MTLVSALARAPSLLVAIAMMLALPFATLRVADEVTHCCCPSPEVCKCPDHRGERLAQPVMRTCHRTTRHLATSQLSAFAPAAPVAVTAPRPSSTVAVAFVAPPHPAPAVRRPDAPS